MPQVKSRSESRISDAAVVRATGWTWDHWFRLLDARCATALTHREIVELVAEMTPRTSGWWQQMITVQYEQARGLRAPHERPDGFEISASKTVRVPVDRLYRAWSRRQTRDAWLPEPALDVRKAKKERSMRIAWPDGRTNVDVHFYATGDEKSRVSVQHGRLDDAEEAEACKRYWRERLASLKERLEG
ncbi:MAG: hypothetical protein HKO59_12715 [Phycisphaerales bacterium]|nr:hypothetical protein [Phycisphaerae bacterium]NNF44582.1 hypothetical protein [Phycisphaerales bacterium]NNM26825.1 hypothetical protein [Phycisphaerales bacterium]